MPARKGKLRKWAFVSQNLKVSEARKRGIINQRIRDNKFFTSFESAEKFRKKHKVKGVKTVSVYISRKKQVKKKSKEEIAADIWIKKEIQKIHQTEKYKKKEAKIKELREKQDKIFKIWKDSIEATSKMSDEDPYHTGSKTRMIESHEELRRWIKEIDKEISDIIKK